MMLPALAAVHLILAADPVGADRYPRAELLAEPADLLTKEGREKVHVLDFRGEQKYIAGNIPRSIAAPLGQWSKAVTAGTADAAFWTAQLSSVGVTSRKPVVVVAENVTDSARAWWMLKLAGVPDVRLLNGGWKGYAAAKGETTTDSAFAIVPKEKWTPSARYASKEDVLRLLDVKPGTANVVDARSPEEFRGETDSAKRNGHVPGAKSLEWSDTLDPKTKRFLPPAELRKLLADRRIDLDQPCVTYCQGGGRAAVLAFVLELMGAKDVRNYYRSWGEWGNDAETPVQKPFKLGG